MNWISVDDALPKDASLPVWAWNGSKVLLVHYDKDHGSGTWSYGLHIFTDILKWKANKRPNPPT